MPKPEQLGTNDNNIIVVVVGFVMFLHDIEYVVSESTYFIIVLIFTRDLEMKTFMIITISCLYSSEFMLIVYSVILIAP